MTAKEIKSLLKLCKQYGVKRVKTAAIELELETHTNLSLDPQDGLKSHPNANGDLSESYSEEQILNWSSGVDV